MATLKVLGGGSSMSQSFKEYFLCCFKKEHKSKDRPGPEGKSEETKLQSSPEREVGSGSSRPSSKMASVEPTSEVKEALSSALVKAKEPNGVRSKSAMSVKITLPNSDNENGRNSRNTNSENIIRDDRESISSRLSRFLTTTPNPFSKEEVTMGTESSNPVVSVVQADDDKAVLLKSTEEMEKTEETQKTEKTFNESVIISPNSDPTSSTPVAVETDLARNVETIADTEAEKQLFDVSDLQVEPTFAGYGCGSINYSVKFEDRALRLIFTVHEARDIPSKDRGGTSHSQIHVVLLPGKKIRYKTKVLAGEKPVFNNQFEFKMKEENLAESSIRMRLYGCERLKKNRLVGEVVIPLSPQNLSDHPTWLCLEPRSNLKHGESALSLNSVNPSESEFSLAANDVMELMLGLAYNSVTGRMAIEVVKGSNFKNTPANRPPDSYVKIALMAPNQQEISRSKTTVRRGQPNPLFKETFMFQVPQFQLPDVSLLVSVFVIKSLKRKEMLGWFTMGQTSSSDDDLSHWTAMLESKGEQVARWHNLLDP